MERELSTKRQSPTGAERKAYDGKDVGDGGVCVLSKD